MMQPMASPKRLDTHILRTYSVMRWFMSGFGFLLPLLLVLGGVWSWWWLAEPLAVQNSLSAYYHAGSCTAHDGVYRDLFVGLLTAISFLLIVYSGFGALENWLLNIAGIFLLGVAFFPTGWPEPQMVCQGIPAFEASKLLGLPISVHLASAVAFFIAIAAVNYFTALDTVRLIKNVAEKHLWTRIFQVARFLMLISIGSVLLLWLVTGTRVIGDRLTLWIEWAGMWAFALYWLLKSIEIRRSQIDIDVVNDKVQWVDISGANQRRRSWWDCKRCLQYKNEDEDEGIE